jgi:hypothetical protein
MSFVVDCVRLGLVVRVGTFPGNRLIERILRGFEILIPKSAWKLAVLVECYRIQSLASIP